MMAALGVAPRPPTVLVGVPVHSRLTAVTNLQVRWAQQISGKAVQGLQADLNFSVHKVGQGC